MKLKSLLLGAAALLLPVVGFAASYYNSSTGVMTYVSEDAYGNIIIQTQNTFTGYTTRKTITPSSPYYQYYLDKYGLSGYDNGYYNGYNDNNYYDGSYNTPYYDPFTVIPYLFFGDHDHHGHHDRDDYGHHDWDDYGHHDRDHHGDHDHDMDHHGDHDHH